MARNCPSCGRANDDDARFCAGCGAEMGPVCASCGAALRSSTAFFSASVNPPPPGRMETRYSAGAQRSSA